MDNDKEEPLTELGLSIGLGSQNTRVGSNEDFGAGANAGSTADIIFVTSTPLSELVWSPRKGVSLKCAECGMVLSPLHSITTSEEAKDTANVDYGNLGLLPTGSHFPCKVSDRVNLVRSPRSRTGITPVWGMTSHAHNLGSSGGAEEMTSKMKPPSSNIDQGCVHSDEKEREKASMPEPECRDLRTSSSPVEVNKDVHSGNIHTTGVQGSFCPEVYTVKQCKLSDTQNPLITSHESKIDELARRIEEDGKNKKNEIQFISPSGKQEFTAENDLNLLKGENVCAEVNIIASQQAEEEGKQCSYQSGSVLPSSPEVPAVEVFPSSNKGPLSQRKDEAKIFSDEGISEKNLKDEDDSHEGVESCNSTGLFPGEKRKWSFEQQMIIDSKKMKQHHHESPHFGPSRKQNSSFMTWISNTIKGLSKSSSDDKPALSLTMRTHRGNHSTETRIGFGTVFKALYCPDSRVQDDKTSTLDSQLEEDNIISPSSTGDDNGKYKQIVLSNDKFNPRIPIDGEGPSTRPNNPFENINFVHENSKENSTQNRNLCKMASNLKRVGVISSSSSLQNDSDSPSEGKDTCKLAPINHTYKSINDLTNRSDSLGNLWITRFSPKISGLMINSPKRRLQNLNSPVEQPNNRIKMLSRAQDSIVSLKDIALEDKNEDKNATYDASRKMQNHLIDTNAYFGFKTREHVNQKKPMSKLNTVNHSQRFKNSEALSYIFSRRLDALRNIILSEVDGNVGLATTICFFCGFKVHKLQECSEITGSKIEKLLKKINPFDGKEESASLCIRCFQLNHWAIACPYSRKESHLDDRKNPSEHLDLQRQIDLTTSGGKNLLVDTEDKVGRNVDSRMKSPVEKGMNMSKEVMLNLKQSASGSTENISKENQITAFCDFVHQHIPAVPRGTFEAVKRLRLSRTDILKWTKSPMPRTCIDGFFLRLRLHKWDEGLGSTGYVVACINGTSGESLFGTHKHTLSVDIVGFKFFIGNRFVSNHDYTEDELMAWWCATLRSGRQMPSEEDLKMKFEDKKKLGF